MRFSSNRLEDFMAIRNREILPYEKSARVRARIYSESYAIAGNTGSGKSTIVELLLEKLEKMVTEGKLAHHFQFISAGQFMRQKAKDEGFTDFMKFLKHSEEHPEKEYDKWCDEQIRKMADKHNYLVGDGRLVNIFMRPAFRIFLDCPEEVCAGRRHKQLKEKAEAAGIPFYRTVGDVLDEIYERNRIDWGRYSVHYPGCKWSLPDYDLVVDTEKTKPVDAAQGIIYAHDMWLTSIRSTQKQVMTQATYELSMKKITGHQTRQKRKAII